MHKIMNWIKTDVMVYTCNPRTQSQGNHFKFQASLIYNASSHDFMVRLDLKIYKVQKDIHSITKHNNPYWWMLKPRHSKYKQEFFLWAAKQNKRVTCVHCDKRFVGFRAKGCLTPLNIDQKKDQEERSGKTWSCLQYWTWRLAGTQVSGQGLEDSMNLYREWLQAASGTHLPF